MDEEYKKKIETAHSNYKKQRPIKCPLLNDEEIVFNREGFNHLIRKGKRLRSREEVLERLSLLCFVSAIISSPSASLSYRSEIQKGKRVEYWGLTTKNKSLKIRVVIRQIESGPKHFYSIMFRGKKDIS